MGIIVQLGKLIYMSHSMFLNHKNNHFCLREINTHFISFHFKSFHFISFHFISSTHEKKDKKEEMTTRPKGRQNPSQSPKKSQILKSKNKGKCPFCNGVMASFWGLLELI